MSNSFYNHGAFPSTGSAATSASMRAELDLVAAGFDKMPTLAGNANKFIVVNSTGTGLTQTDVLPAFTVTDTDFTVQDDGDNTRKFQFNAGSITTGNTRVYVMPDLDTTLVGTNVTQTLTNKTLTAPVIATIVNTGTLTLPTSTDTLVGRNTTDTLTNKTLTNPVIGTIVNTGTLTLPTSTDTLVGRQTTDTLTNKTISGASNTLSNIANGSLSNSSIVIGSSTLSLGGTMTTLAGVTISGASNTLSNIANASLTNSSITINGSTVALGSSVTVTATATNALTIGNGLSGTSYNGSAAVTIAINTGVTADLSTAQTFSNKTISGSANTLTNIANASLTNSAITIGSTAISLGATSLTLAGLTSASATTLISTGNQATSVAISAIGHSSGTVTVTTSTAHGLTTGDTASIDGVADYTFCGVYTVTVTNANVFTYSQTASGASSSGGFSTKLTGTWGLYAGGTGPSLHNGPVIVSASSQMPALRVTQGGSGYALIVEDAANPDTSAFIISNAGDLAINTNKFTVAAASGNTVIAGTTSLNGNVTFATDATYDIGASGATRPRDLFLSRNLTVGGTLTLAGGVNLNGNVTIGDASTDTLTITSTITSNLIFTDNTYDIGASGATRPRNLYLAGLLTMGGALSVTGATTLTGALNANGNVTLGNAAADNVTVTGTITSNLIFTDNTYDIGASGATRPANAWFSRTITAGQGTGQNWQFLATDYAQGTGGGVADGIYTNSIKAGTYQGFGFDTKYDNAGSWVASQTSASIIDGYQGNFRFYGRNDLTAGAAYTPALRFTVSPVGLASLWTAVTADPGITNSLQIGRASYDITYGGVLGMRSISGDQRQGLFARSTGSLTNVALYNIDFLTGQTAVPVAADTGLAMRIYVNKAVSIGGADTDSYPLQVWASGSAGTSKEMLNINYSAAGAAEPLIRFTSANGLLGKIGFITGGATAGQFQLYTADGTSAVTRVQVDSAGVWSWTNVGSSSGGTRMTLNATGLGVGRTANSVMDAYYPATSISGVTSYGNALTAQAGTGTLTISGGTGNQRGVAMIVNANQNSSFSVPIGANYDNIGLLAATKSVSGAYTNHAVLGFNESDGPTRAFTAYTTSTGASQTAIGYYVANVATSGASSASYGIYIANSISSAGNAYAFASDATNDSYFSGRLGVSGTLQSNYGVLQVYQASSGTQSSLGFIGTDNATISSKYSLVFQIDSLSAQSGRAYSWKHNGKGYSDGDLLMTLNADTNQLLVGTSSAVTDAYAGAAYPAIVSSSSVAYRPIDGNGAASLVAKAFATNPGNTYTVRVYPSDTVYAVMDIRVGGYSSSGSGSANAYFAYGGHVGAYQLNTVFNTSTGNVVISAPSIGASFVQFTITITGGAGGVYVVKVSDAGNTSNKTAWITVT